MKSYVMKITGDVSTKPSDYFLVKLRVKVIPSSSKDAITGWQNEALKVKVKAPAENGKANKTVLTLLEQRLCLAKGTISIKSGFTSSIKIVEIDTVSGDIIKRLEYFLAISYR